MSGEELKPAAWRYEKNGVVALHSRRKPLYLTPGMGEWTETPLYAAPVEPAPSEDRLRDSDLSALIRKLDSCIKTTDNYIFYLCEDDAADVIRAALSGSAFEDKGGEG